MKGLTTRLAASATVLVALGMTGGCGESDAATAAAVSKVANRASPGFVRVINLMEEPVTAFDRGRPMLAEISPDGTSRFVPMGTGKRTLEIKGSKASNVDLELRSGSGVDLLLLSPGKVALVEDEVRYADGDKNLRVVLLDRTGKPLPAGASATVKGPSGPMKVTAGKISAAEGDYRAEGGGFTNTSNVTIEPKFAYTFLFVQANKGYRAYLMRNADNDQPVAGQQSNS